MSEEEKKIVTDYMLLYSQLQQFKMKQVHTHDVHKRLEHVCICEAMRNKLVNTFVKIPHHIKDRNMVPRPDNFLF